MKNLPRLVAQTHIDADGDIRYIGKGMKDWACLNLPLWARVAILTKLHEAYATGCDNTRDSFRRLLGVGNK